MTSQPQDRPGAPGLRALFRPSSLEPAELDLRVVFSVGIGLWTLALVVVAVLAVTGRAPGVAVATCAAGVVLGFLALGWERRHRTRTSS